MQWKPDSAAERIVYAILIFMVVLVLINHFLVKDYDLFFRLLHLIRAVKGCPDCVEIPGGH
jgi:hypothetical protein